MAKEDIPVIAATRLPYHPALQQRFGVDQTAWRALVESTFPAAQTTEAVILALAYCKARKLDPFKKPVHIVPIWDSKRRCMIETVWPGIGEYRTTAFRTGQYAGKDKTEFGPTIEETWRSEKAEVTLKFPEWAQVTVYRFHGETRIAYPGPCVYWLETFSSTKEGLPNSIWQKRPNGQIEKCAEAAALRAAFPEEIGDEESADEAGAWIWNGRDAIDVKSQASNSTAILENAAKKQPAVEAEENGGEIADESTTEVAEPPLNPPTAAEVAQHAPDTAADDAIMLGEWKEELAKCATPDAVEELIAEAKPPQHLRDRVLAMCAERKRETRGQVNFSGSSGSGEKSNGPRGKQKSLMPS